MAKEELPSIMAKRSPPPQAADKLALLDRRTMGLEGELSELTRRYSIIEFETGSAEDTRASALRSATTPGASYEVAQLDKKLKDLAEQKRRNRAEYADHGKRAMAHRVFVEKCRDYLKSQNYLLPGETNPQPGIGPDALDVAIIHGGTTTR